MDPKTASDVLRPLVVDLPTTYIHALPVHLLARALELVPVRELLTRREVFGALYTRYWGPAPHSTRYLPLRPAPTWTTTYNEYCAARMLDVVLSFDFRRIRSEIGFLEFYSPETHKLHPTGKILARVDYAALWNTLTHTHGVQFSRAEFNTHQQTALLRNIICNMVFSVYQHANKDLYESITSERYPSLVPYFASNIASFYESLAHMRTRTWKFSDTPIVSTNPETNTNRLDRREFDYARFHELHAWLRHQEEEHGSYLYAVYDDVEPLIERRETHVGHPFATPTSPAATVQFAAFINASQNLVITPKDESSTRACVSDLIGGQCTMLNNVFPQLRSTIPESKAMRALPCFMYQYMMYADIPASVLDGMCYVLTSYDVSVERQRTAPTKLLLPDGVLHVHGSVRPLVFKWPRALLESSTVKDPRPLWMAVHPSDTTVEELRATWTQQFTFHTRNCLRASTPDDAIRNADNLFKCRAEYLMQFVRMVPTTMVYESTMSKTRIVTAISGLRRLVVRILTEDFPVGRGAGRVPTGQLCSMAWSAFRTLLRNDQATYVTFNMRGVYYCTVASYSPLFFLFAKW